MVRVLRWLTMIAATLLIAFGCAMLTWRFGLPLLHTNVRSSDRLLLALGAATVVGAVVALPLAWWAGHEASEAGDWTEFVEQFGPSLKSPRLPTVAEVNPYSIGVEASAYVGGNTRPPYCPRDIDGALDAALASSSFVLVSGDSAAGKSRASYEAALRAFPDRTIVVPKADAPLDRLFTLGKRARVLGPRVLLRFALLNEAEELLQRDLFESSVRDPLTKAYNKRYLAERMLPYIDGRPLTLVRCIEPRYCDRGDNQVGQEGKPLDGNHGCWTHLAVGFQPGGGD